MNNKPKVMITFKDGGENGGPYNSHKRIIESQLKESYDFVPLPIPQGRIGVLNLKLLFTLRKIIVKQRPDIVHFTGLQLEGFHVALACRISGIKNIVLAIRGSSLEAREFAAWKKAIVNILEIATLKLALVSYSVSEYVDGWKRVKKYSKWNFGTIYNMPKSEFKISSSDVSFRNEIGVDKQDVLIVSTGRITREKGFDILLDSIKKMEIPSSVKFIIVGNGDYFETFKNEIKKYQLDESVILLGYRNDVDRILSECDIFVIASLHETLCNSVVEAANYGLPVVATDVGGIPEIIIDGYNGYLVKTNDSKSIAKHLTFLINNEKNRKEMGNRGNEIINTKFSMKKIENQIDDLYRRVLNYAK